MRKPGSAPPCRQAVPGSSPGLAIRSTPVVSARGLLCVFKMFAGGHAPDAANSLTGFRLAYTVGGAVEVIGAVLALQYVRNATKAGVNHEI